MERVINKGGKKARVLNGEVGEGGLSFVTARTS